MLIGARTAAWSGALSAKDYVQSGLIAMWDGIENAGWGRHTSVASTWVDLIGGNNFTLDSNASFGSNYLQTGGASACGVASAYANSDIYAIESLFVLDAIPTLNTALFNSGVVSIHGYTKKIGLMNANRGLHPDNYSTWGFPPTGIDVSVSVNYHDSSTWGLNVSVVSNISTYVPGLKSTGATIDASASRGYGCYVGGFLNSAASGKLKCIRMYNRNLTAAEIAANYAIDKARFGIS